MKYKRFSMKKDGFVGHLAEVDENSDTTVVIIKSILSTIKFAECFAEYVSIFIEVSLYYAECFSKSVDRILLNTKSHKLRYILMPLAFKANC